MKENEIDSNLLKKFQKAFPVMNIIYNPDYKCDNLSTKIINDKIVFYDIGISNITIVDIRDAYDKMRII